MHPDDGLGGLAGMWVGIDVRGSTELIIGSRYTFFVDGYFERGKPFDKVLVRTDLTHRDSVGGIKSEWIGINGEDPDFNVVGSR